MTEFLVFAVIALALWNVVLTVGLIQAGRQIRFLDWHIKAVSAAAAGREIPKWEDRK